MIDITSRRLHSIRRRFAPLVAEILEARELALLGRREQPSVADLADVELQRVGRLEALVLGEEGVVGLLLVLVFDLVEGRQQLEHGLGRLGFQRRLGKRLLHSGLLSAGRSAALEM